MTDAPRWRIADPEIRLVGRVTYRCLACGHLIAGDVAFTSGDPRSIRTYHPEHFPALEDPDHGR